MILRWIGIPVLIVLGLCFTQVAFAQSSRMYFAGYFGLNTFSDQDYSENITPTSGDIEYENAVSFAGALGFRLNESFRLEAEIGYRNAEVASLVSSSGTTDIGGEVSTTSFLLNGYYDFTLDWGIEPFITAGVGFGLHDGDILGVNGITASDSGDDVTLLYQLGGGLKYRLSDDFAFTGGYRYLGSSDISFGNTDIGYSSHEFRLGIEYDLPTNWDLFD